MWALAGKIALFLFLSFVPIGYFLWLIMGLFQISRPKEPSSTLRSENIPQSADRIERILVPLGDGPNVLLGLQLVAQLTGNEKGKITLLRIIPPASSSNIEEQTRIVKNMVHKSLLDLQHNFELDVKIEISKDIVQTIVETSRSGGYDLLVVGASEQTHVGSFLFGTIPYQLAELSPCPVVIIRRPLAA